MNGPGPDLLCLLKGAGGSAGSFGRVPSTPSSYVPFATQKRMLSQPVPFVRSRPHSPRCFFLQLPEVKEDAEDEAVPAAPQPLALLTPLPCAPEAEPPPTTPPAPALTLEGLQGQLEALKELQGQYIQGQLKVRRTCQHFPRSLRALSLQICRTRRRLIRTEVRLQRREKEGAWSRSLPLALASASLPPPPHSRASQ
ncbi:pleckstrin homology domain-containing family A member 7-like [Elgaria multicarinata webbii]|uniref:pleckstrin homology domain-containing family A member 7-like n=1 Tax=Elgaria multicarinata webbii TaxID=159646 RepID=UPI002FCD1AA5